MPDTLHELTLYAQRHNEPYNRWAEDYTELKLKVSELLVQNEELGKNAATRWFSTAHVARRFGVHPRTINRWVREGKFPKPIAMGPDRTHRFWHIDELEEFEQRKMEERNADASQAD